MTEKERAFIEQGVNYAVDEITRRVRNPGSTYSDEQKSALLDLREDLQAHIALTEEKADD